MNNDYEEKEPLISELSERVTNGLFKENPTFVLLLGMCPTLAVTTSAKNGLGMGVTTLVVLALSNLFISLLRKVIPDKIRIPAFIVIIASFVTIVELLLNAYIPSLYKALGLYIPLIVVNCIILGRAEAYAYSHRPLPSLFDGIGMGMGFTMALTIIGALRELIGAGTVFSFRVMPSGYVPVSIFIMAPGAFFVLAILTAIQNKIKEIGEKNGKDMSKIQSGCGGNCLDCNKDCKVTLSEGKISEDEVKTDNIIVEQPKAKEALTEKKESSEFKNTEVKKTTGKKKVKAEKRNEKQPVENTVEETAETTTETTAGTTEEAKSKAKSKVNTKTTEETIVSDKIDDALEILDFSNMKDSIKKSPASGKKPVRKKASLEKAQAMLEKAEETMKEEKHD